MLENLRLKGMYRALGLRSISIVFQHCSQAIQVASRKAIGRWLSVVHAVLEPEDEVGLPSSSAEEATMFFIPEELALCF
jgi:hypothetical protein